MEQPGHRVRGPCPSDTDLMCSTTGELSPDAWRVVRQHLEHCPSCRANMRATLHTLSSYAQLMDPEPPERLQASRERLEGLMAAARADREAVSPWRRWLAAAAALVAVVTGLMFRTDPIAYADEVVARAAQRERAVTMPADLWRLSFIPGAEAQTAWGNNGASSGAEKALPAQVIRVLETHGFDPTHPLSLARLQAWRASNRDRREQVTHRDKWLVVKSATRGALREVELVIDEASYQLVKQTWVIAGMGRVVCERVKLGQPSGVPSREAPRAESGQ
jgi:hypothetical protein